MYLDKLYPMESSDRTKAETDHKAKQVLVKEQLAKMTKIAVGMCSLYENLLRHCP
jgi:hypothetical protein